jgi:TrmH family RNA methyltransferase
LRTGQFLAEGTRFLVQAIEHRATIDGLVVAPELLTNALGRRLAWQVRQAGVPVLELPARAYLGLTAAAEPPGLGIVVRQRWERMATVRPGDETCWVAVESVRSAGNLGSIIRTCEAVGAAGVILIGDAVDPFDPATVRATMGAIFAQRFVRATPGQLAAWVDRFGATLVGTSPSAVVDYRTVAYRPPLVLLMGGERKGLPHPLQRLCHAMVSIPMAGAVDSLNLAVATGILLYEAFNQRRDASTMTCEICRSV